MQKILTIDNDPLWIDAVEESLQEDNYKLIYATSGEEGFRKAVAELPDLILEDNLKINNRFLWEELKEDPRTKDIKKILFGTIEVNQEETFRRGAIDCITKPFKPEGLRRKVKEVFMEIYMEKFYKDVAKFLEIQKTSAYSPETVVVIDNGTVIDKGPNKDELFSRYFNRGALIMKVGEEIRKASFPSPTIKQSIF